MRFSGSGVGSLFAPEAGGHRFQRVPPTEKRGRRQTSSITVAVLGESAASAEFDPEDVLYDTYIGQGAGGQHRQKNATAVRATHVPTGTIACCENERSLGQNMRSALAVLKARVQDELTRQRTAEENSERRGQIGTGYRGDKVRTVQMQNDRVTNHLTGRTCSAKRYLKGELEAIQ